jgi:hypothetical protein
MNPNATNTRPISFTSFAHDSQWRERAPTFLLEQGADINTNWSTHEPASMLHECAVHGNCDAARFLIDRGIDMTRLDYRWNATAEGWARHAAKDEQMAGFLAAAEREQNRT